MRFADPNKTTATLHTGDVVCSASPAWRAECEARHWLGLSTLARVNYLEGIATKRGAEAAKALEAMAARCEPGYVLSLSSRDDRLAYLASVERRQGAVAANRLREQVMALHVASKQAQAA